MSHIEDALLRADLSSIDVVMRQPLPRFQLIGGSVGPLRANERVSLPLWLALLLRQQHKCTVVVPDWLCLEWLRAASRRESADRAGVGAMSWHWEAVAGMLLQIADADFAESPHALRVLVDELRDIRASKVRGGLRDMDGVYLDLTGLALMEIAELKSLLSSTMSLLASLSKTLESE